MINKKTYKKVMLGLISSAILISSNISYAMPQGGSIVSGSGTIGSPSGGQMNIAGNGGNMAIDWSSFGIGAGEVVNFSNLNAVLNYVTGNQRSEIFGNINGNGVHVFLINPNGILFGASAQINVGSLTASTRSMSEEVRKNFNGTLPSLTNTDIANVKADIVNLGTITADTLVMEANNISIVSADKLAISNKGNISLKAKGAINIGYQVTDRTTVDVGDGQPAHDVANYQTGTGTKGSVTLAGMNTTDLSGANKTVNDCMLVNNIYELQNIQSNLNGNYMLAGDIDAAVTSGWNNGSGFKPLGDNYWSDPIVFTGVLDGLGYNINDFYMNRPDKNLGALILQTGSNALVNNFQMNGTINAESSIVGWNYGTISNIINTANINSSTTGRAGGIVVLNEGVIENVVNKGNVTGEMYVGGIVSYNSGKISGAVNEGNLIGIGAVGGIAGNNERSGTIDNSSNAGNVDTLRSGSSAIGGIAGTSTGRITNVSNSGNIKGYVYTENIAGTSEIGGIVGYNNGGQVENAINSGKVSGDSIVGGIVGYNDEAASIKNSSNSGDISVVRFSLGGIAGYNGTNSIIEGVINTGKISSDKGTQVGGILGNNTGANATVSKATNSGDVSATEFVGGIIGYNNGATTGIKNSTNSGNITADKYAGGIVGYNKLGNISDLVNKGNVATGNISGQGYSGGIAGANTGLITNAENSGQISGRSYVGGIVGYLLNGSSVANTHNSGTITVSNSAGGGIVGYLANGSIYSSYNDGSITGQGYIGGIVGRMTDNNIIRNVYNIGDVVASHQVAGGIVGNVEKGNNSITNAYNAGTVSGVSFIGDVIGYITKTTGSISASNTYFINSSGHYEQYGTGTTYEDLNSFNQAFNSGLESIDKDVWRFQTPTTPHLKHFLAGDITADLGNMDIAINDNLLAVLIAKLTELGYQLDASKIYALGNLEQGTYNWSDLIYSGQDGYSLNLTGTVVIGAARVDPPAIDNIVDNRYEMLTSDLNNSKTATWQYSQQQEYTFTEDARLLIVDDYAIKLEDSKVNIQQEEKRKKVSTN